MILIIDNYDSFTHSLYQYLREFGADAAVYRNDALSVAEAVEINPAGVIISSGAGTPAEAGISLDLVRELSGKTTLLGVGLGMHIISTAFGATLSSIAPAHGKSVGITANNGGIFAGINRSFKGMCYHSQVIEPSSLPPSLDTTATDENGRVMAIAHRSHQTYGVQFHPESIMTPMGKRILRNYLDIVEQNLKTEP